MAQLKQFEVYDLATGELLAKGSARHCSEVLHVGGDSIRAVANGNYRSRKYEIKDVTPTGAEESKNDHNLVSAAKRWDAFCEPIRKKYGIPVYKAPAKDEK